MANLEARVVRYADLVPCLNAFIDCRTPGSEAKENFTIIGPGVSENPNQHVHIAEPHGFNIGGARQPPGCVNSQHSHKTAEVFVVHSGRWRFDLGEHGDAAQVELAPGDVISLPVDMFRGFTSIGPADDGTPGFLWAVLGGDDPGRVTWAPRVFELARDYGLTLLEGGRLVDTAAGETLPPGAEPMVPTGRDEADALWRPTPADAAKLVARTTVREGEKPVIGPGGPLGWPHDFTLDRLDLAAGASTAEAMPPGVEVVFVHRGTLVVTTADGAVTLGEGDTLSVPTGLARRFASAGGAAAFIARGPGASG